MPGRSKAKCFQLHSKLKKGGKPGRKIQGVDDDSFSPPQAEPAAAIPDGIGKLERAIGLCTIDKQHVKGSAASMQNRFTSLCGDGDDVVTDAMQKESVTMPSRIPGKTFKVSLVKEENWIDMHNVHVQD